MPKKNFLSIIEKQRSKKKKPKFKGTLLEYLDMVQKDPSIIKHAHKRLYDCVVARGITELDDADPRKRKIFNDDNVKTYDYFQKEFFGHENVIARIMRFLKSASLKGEESRQVLLLMGPVGAGKSAITEHIKSVLEQEPYYHLEGDPQRGEPLQLVPRSLRSEFEDVLGVKIEGDISPIARHVLLEEMENEAEAMRAYITAC